MKAFIFNSGSGSRMGELTKNNPKALVKLHNGESILHRQVRLLNDVGIFDIVISTGPFEDQIKTEMSDFSTTRFRFVNNSKYAETNSIFSMYLCKDYFDDDFIILHGDLVFDSLILGELLAREGDICISNTILPLPPKDFKAKIVNNKLLKISVDIFDEDCRAFQPLYKLGKHTIDLWLNEVENYVQNGHVKVYAENALNQILDKVNIKSILYNDFFIDEIDNLEDYQRVANTIRDIDYRNQYIIESTDSVLELKKLMNKYKISKPLLVSNDFIIANSNLKSFVYNDVFGKIPTFTYYSPNPKYEEVVEGIKTFRSNECDSLIAVGGGSSIDVAKAIKMFLSLDQNRNYLEQEVKYHFCRLITIPTTAGTGSESTRYSVIYYKDEKQSLTHDTLLPDAVILDPTYLLGLPDLHKKSSLLDAFCQAIEASWSINSNDISRKYSYEALSLILRFTESYLNGIDSTYSKILKASNLAGKAINITQTTAPHAMSYKITSLTNTPHGQAVSLCLPHVLEHMIHTINENHLDPSKKKFIEDRLEELCHVFEVKHKEDLLMKITQYIDSFGLKKPIITEAMIPILTKSVNQTRLKNHPIPLDDDAIRTIYFKLL